MCCDVFEAKDALAFLGAALAKREQPAQSAIGGAIARISEQARSVFEVKARADDELDPADLFGGEMAAHHAGEVLRSVTAIASSPSSFAVATSSFGCEPPRRKEKLVVTSSSA